MSDFVKRLRGILFAAPAIVLATAFFGTISIVASFFDRTGELPIRVARAWAGALLAISRVKVRVEGLDQIDPYQGSVFISNHLSYMDTPVALAHIPVQFRFLAKRGLFKIPFLGQHLTHAGHIPVPRDDPRAAVKVMQTAAETIQRKRISLLIFPEGGRSHTGRLNPFKEGGAYIAIRAGAQLVPMVLIGTRGVLPYGSGVVMPGDVILRILAPIDTSQFALKDRASLTEHVRSLILKELGGAE